jgi:hypothetical protein
VKSVDGGVTVQVTVLLPFAATVVATEPLLTVLPRCDMVKLTLPDHEPEPEDSWTTAETMTADPGLYRCRYRHR